MLAGRVCHGANRHLVLGRIKVISFQNEKDDVFENQNVDHSKW